MSTAGCLAFTVVFVVAVASVHTGASPQDGPMVLRGTASPRLTARVLSVRPIVASKSRRVGPAVTGGSGLDRFGTWTLVAQDDSSELAAMADDGRIEHLRVFESVDGRDRFHPAFKNKNQKPDVEAIARVRVRASVVRGLGLNPGRNRTVEVVLLFGSGSMRDVRDRIAVVIPRLPLSASAVRVVKATDLYDRLRAAVRLTGENGQLNLEAAAPVSGGRAIRLYNRGNSGSKSITASVDVSTDEFMDYLRAASRDSVISFQPTFRNPVRYDLGTSDGFAVSIGEAIALPSRIAFGGAGAILLAGIAEATTNALDDGATSGTVIGLQTATGFELLLAPVMQDGKPSSLKIEGLAVISTRLVGRGAYRRLVMRVNGVVDTDSTDPLVPSDLVELEVALALE